ncbi:hypothetical protein NEOLI_000002 [Neolecta irregularis DAH-3]|uniref:Uncharacterized protein n=1 Tax=Neolecta irregularis (strain DAH-3) TaxID=1198029 RepID=A0A1U7LWE3_NEOID|nr:hypothetical protein NEOLI_000002 [Neolecta irregularis DAH-3]|eukprot:OLL26987.1 hypothetical protein NEOLI_000002 [Neolecta irregularis DAH-3]
MAVMHLKPTIGPAHKTAVHSVRDLPGYLTKSTTIVICEHRESCYMYFSSKDKFHQHFIEKHGDQSLSDLDMLIIGPAEKGAVTGSCLKRSSIDSSSSHQEKRVCSQTGPQQMYIPHPPGFNGYMAHQGYYPGGWYPTHYTYATPPLFYPMYGGYTGYKQ